jgi:hypothetical protein
VKSSSPITKTASIWLLRGGSGFVGCVLLGQLLTLSAFWLFSVFEARGSSAGTLAGTPCKAGVSADTIVGYDNGARILADFSFLLTTHEMSGYDGLNRSTSNEHLYVSDNSNGTSLTMQYQYDEHSRMTRKDRIVRSKIEGYKYSPCI